MIGSNLQIKNGTIIVYRVYDISHEINLELAKESLEKSYGLEPVRRYKIDKDPNRSITLKDAPLILSGADEELEFVVGNEMRKVCAQVGVKIWNYGVVSISFKIKINMDSTWKDLCVFGSAIESGQTIDSIAKRKKNEISEKIRSSLKKQHNHEMFEDYTTFVIEEITEKKKDIGPSTITDPLDALKSAAVAELLLSEPTRALSEITRKSITSNISQYTKKDLLVLDWNSSLVFDFTKEKEFQEYIDIIEFSISQLLKLRIYDHLLDERLDELYDSMEKNEHNQITDFYSKLSTEANQIYLEFSDFFEKIDNSVKTVGDFYSAKVLKSANKRLGLDELKGSMSRKIETLSKISSMLHSRVDSLINDKRNEIAEINIKKSHKMEFAILIMILIELMATIKSIVVSTIN